jgi:putative ribosome biogenesis GTPase RsgA
MIIFCPLKLECNKFDNSRFTHTRCIKEIESWKKDPFFKTSAVATILKEVRNKSFVVITGPSGIGKSTIVKLVALHGSTENFPQISSIMYICFILGSKYLTISSGHMTGRI